MADDSRPLSNQLPEEPEHTLVCRTSPPCQDWQPQLHPTWLVDQPSPTVPLTAESAPPWCVHCVHSSVQTPDEQTGSIQSHVHPHPLLRLSTLLFPPCHVPSFATPPPPSCLPFEAPPVVQGPHQVQRREPGQGHGVGGVAAGEGQAAINHGVAVWSGAGHLLEQVEPRGLVARGAAAVQEVGAQPACGREWGRWVGGVQELGLWTPCKSLTTSTAGEGTYAMNTLVGKLRNNACGAQAACNQSSCPTSLHCVSPWSTHPSRAWSPP